MSWLAVDTETTGLDPTRHVPWEVAIVEPDGTEHVWRWRPTDADMAAADLEALRIGRFAERAPEYRPHVERNSAHEIADLLEGAVLVGSNPGFDVAMLTALFRRYGRTLDSHYRPVDVATLAAGWLHGRAAAMLRTTVHPAAAELPWSSTALSLACRVDLPDDDVRHTALADALWARELYLHIMGR